jgi:hypothetical protein
MGYSLLVRILCKSTIHTRRRNEFGQGTRAQCFVESNEDNAHYIHLSLLMRSYLSGKAHSYQFWHNGECFDSYLWKSTCVHQIKKTHHALCKLVFPKEIYPLQGQLLMLHWWTFKSTYDHNYTMAYSLVDDIYPKWSTFTKTISHP